MLRGMLAVLLLSACSRGLPSSAQARPADLLSLESRLAQLQKQYDIPGMAAGVAIGGQIVWTAGFGQADRARAVPATDTTIFQLASLTKTFATVVILQLMQEGKLSLDDPIAQYGIVDIPNTEAIRIRHLMSHTSEGVPGTRYNYSGDRFGLMDQVVRKVTGKGFAVLVAERVVRPLALERTGPGLMVAAAAVGMDTLRLHSQLAQGYQPNGRDPVAYPTYIGTAAGMVSSVRDLLTYSAALDTDRLLSPETRRLAFTPTISVKGDSLPYGLGWFTTRFQSHRMVWHYGFWTGNSSLIIKVPHLGATFVLLANSDRLSSPFPLGAGNLLVSPFAKAFLDWLESTR